MRLEPVNNSQSTRVSNEIIESSGCSPFDWVCRSCQSIARSKIEREMSSRGYAIPKATDATTKKEVETEQGDTGVTTNVLEDVTLDEGREHTAVSESKSNWFIQIIASLGKSIEDAKRENGRTIIKNRTAKFEHLAEKTQN